MLTKEQTTLVNEASWQTATTVNPATPVLRCVNLKKTFIDGKIQVEVLKGISLTVKHGELLAIMGSSGSGKSTLLHLLGGLDKPTSGQVWINSAELTALSETKKGQLRNRELGFVYQFHHLLPEFNALENVALPLLIRHVKPAIAQEKAKELLAQVGLSHRMQHRIGELSGGERQRVAIARALVTDAKCVLADEPTGNLDNRTAEQVFDLILQLNKSLNTSFVIVTHDPNLAKRMHRTLTLVNGQLQD